MKRILIALLLFVSIVVSGQPFFNYYHQRTSGGGGGGPTSQNLILQSEATNVTPWTIYADWQLNSANTGTDTDANTTMENWWARYVEGWLYQLVDLSTSTTYVIGFDAYWATGSCSTLEMEVADHDAGAGFAYLLQANFSTSTTGTVQSFAYEFTTLSDPNISIAFHIISSCDADIYIGRVHLYEGNLGDHTYCTTTTAVCP